MFVNEVLPKYKTEASTNPEKYLKIVKLRQARLKAWHWAAAALYRNVGISEGFAAYV